MTPRLTSSLAISLALHAIVVGTLALTYRLTSLPPPIPIELLLPPPPPPVEAVAPSPPASADEKTSKPEKTTEGPRPPRPRPPKKTPPAVPLPPPPPTEDVRAYAPTGNRLVLMMRSDKLRASPHRAGVETLLSALPDYDTLLGGTTLKLFEDIDALVIATPNPHDVRVTFLAATFRDDARVRPELEKRKLADWDPRVFRFVRAGLAALVGPEQAPTLDDEKSALRQQLEGLDRFTSSPEGTALLLTASDLRSLVRFGADLPTPESLSLATTADASPRVRITAQMTSTADAEALTAAWPEIRARYKARTGLLGIGAALDRLQMTATEKTVEVSGIIDEVHIRLALGWVGMRIRAQRGSGTQ